jgi:hypothetical protein
MIVSTSCTGMRLLTRFPPAIDVHPSGYDQNSGGLPQRGRGLVPATLRDFSLSALWRPLCGWPNNGAFGRIFRSSTACFVHPYATQHLQFETDRIPSGWTERCNRGSNAFLFHFELAEASEGNVVVNSD